MEQTKNILDRWLFKKKENNLSLAKVHSLAKELDFTAVIKAFTCRLEAIPCKFSKSEEVSGSICFFGGVFTSLLHYGYIEEIEGLFTFALCYMLIDHFLDDNTISQEEKKKSMSEIYSFMQGEEVSDNKLIQAARDRYLDLIIRVPSCQDVLIRLLKSELKGVTIQENPNLSRETYLEIAEEKGGLTAAVIGNIIGLKDENESEKLGTVIQLVDDALDTIDDEKLGIFTLARYDLQNKNFDEYIYYTIGKINELSPVYNFFRPILLLGLILAINDNPGCISKPLEELLYQYNLFSENMSKDYLNAWFHDKLYEYIEKNI